jgi:hypothetical protein
MYTSHIWRRCEDIGDRGRKEAVDLEVGNSDPVTEWQNWARVTWGEHDNIHELRTRVLGETCIGGFDGE